MALKQVKNKIVSTQKTGQVTKAMEAVSAVKMRKSQEKALSGRPYVRSAMRILSRLAASRDGIHHPWVVNGTPVDRSANRVLLVLVTSDKGLAGAVNSAVIKQADELIATGRQVEVVAIGRKAKDYAERMGLPVLGSYTNISDDVMIGDISDMTNLVFKQYETGNYDTVEVIYQNFLSTFEQLPTKRQVLPLDTAEIHYVLKSIRPKTGKYSEEAETNGHIIDYIVEPSVEEVMNTLLPRLVEIMLYHSLIESKASEHSARMVAMRNATDKAKEMVKSLTIKYNKARQAAITAEVSEITAGVAAME